MDIVVSILHVFELHHEPMSEATLEIEVNLQTGNISKLYRYLMSFRAVIPSSRS